MQAGIARYPAKGDVSALVYLVSCFLRALATLCCAGKQRRSDIDLSLHLQTYFIHECSWSFAHYRFWFESYVFVNICINFYKFVLDPPPSYHLPSSLSTHHTTHNASKMVSSAANRWVFKLSQNFPYHTEFVSEPIDYFKATFFLENFTGKINYFKQSGGGGVNPSGKVPWKEFFS